MIGQEPAPIRVMVVDDHPIWRDAVARDLTGAGYEVVATASDAGQAIRIAPAVRPDVVLLDMHLPDQSGVVDVVDVGERILAKSCAEPTVGG